MSQVPPQSATQDPSASQLVNRVTGIIQDVPNTGSEVSATGASELHLEFSAADILGTMRVGDDLIINLDNGRQVFIRDYYAFSRTADVLDASGVPVEVDAPPVEESTGFPGRTVLLVATSLAAAGAAGGGGSGSDDSTDTERARQNNLANDGSNNANIPGVPTRSNDDDDDFSNANIPRVPDRTDNDDDDDDFSNSGGGSYQVHNYYSSIDPRNLARYDDDDHDDDYDDDDDYYRDRDDSYEAYNFYASYDPRRSNHDDDDDDDDRDDSDETYSYYTNNGIRVFTRSDDDDYDDRDDFYEIRNYYAINGQQTRTNFDFNRDGETDAIWTYQFNAAGHRTQTMIDGNADGTIDSVVIEQRSNIGRLEAEIFDYNNDGFIDSIRFGETEHLVGNGFILQNSYSGLSVQGLQSIRFDDDPSELTISSERVQTIANSNAGHEILVQGYHDSRGNTGNRVNLDGDFVIRDEDGNGGPDTENRGSYTYAIFDARSEGNVVGSVLIDVDVAVVLSA